MFSLAVTSRALNQRKYLKRTLFSRRPPANFAATPNTCTNDNLDGDNLVVEDVHSARRAALLHSANLAKAPALCMTTYSHSGALHACIQGRTCLREKWARTDGQSTCRRTRLPNTKP
jgi:hypothetical protein